jgi:hypothetical protein
MFVMEKSLRTKTPIKMWKNKTKISKKKVRKKVTLAKNLQQLQQQKIKNLK